MDQKNRLKSLDALRGFDMLFIMGLAGWVVAFCHVLPACGFTEWLSTQMTHVEWNGLRHHDTIFPLFLFVAGISFPFSLAAQQAAGKTDSQIIVKIIRRGLLLVLLGLIYQGLLQFKFDTQRYASVLARIGLAWMFAALLWRTFNTKTNIIIAVAILIGYWLLMWLVPQSTDPYSFENNLVGAIDRVLLPGRLYEKTFDPEGILSTLPAIVTALLGMFTGQFVRLSTERFSGNKKTVWMLIAGVSLIVVGYLWSFAFPINKKLWTSTFVLVVAGYSVIMFAIFYYIIDVRGWSKYSLFFRVVGLNSITIYLAQRIIDFSKINNFFFGGIIGKCPESLAPLITSTGYIVVCWVFLYILYKQKIFLKV